MRPAELCAALDDARRQLDAAWQSVLAEQAARDPERAATVLALLAATPIPDGHGVGAGFFSARLAWPHLDIAAQQEWLRAFLAVWRGTVGNPSLRRELARAVVVDERGAA